MRTRLLALFSGAALLALLTACAGAPTSRLSSERTPPAPATSPSSQGVPEAHSSGGLTGAGSGSADLTERKTPTPSPAAATPAGAMQVDIRDFSFQPAKIQVKVGTTVNWTNRDTMPHTVTFRDDSVRGSDVLRQGQSFTHTFTAAGTYPYYCAPHTYMMGTVTVIG